MSRLDKATAEQHTKTLRELVKRPENKLCADCKRNDPRWASWNLGVFLCIRCSGIHRGMGTHISRVKSVDLDMWTPEQMDSILKWGNQRANLYWEALLKAGHVPPDHKMESFIRSKYESRRWAMDEPPPKDPSVLEGTGPSTPSPALVQQQTRTASHTSRPSHSSVSGRRPASPVLTTRQPQPHQLLSTAVAERTQRAPSGSAASASQAAPPPPQPKAPENDLFSLDFHALNVPSHTVSATSSEPKKDTKNDILSLFSTSTSPAQRSGFDKLGGQLQHQQQDPWGQFSGGAKPQQQTIQPTSMMGLEGTGQWGVTSGWNAPSQTIPPAQGNLWGNSAPMPAPQKAALGSTEMWASATPAVPSVGGDLFSTPFASNATTQKSDDAFDDLWGGFK